MTLKRLASLFAAIAMAFAVLSAPLQAQEDKKGGKDHPLLSRMPNYFLEIYEEKEFDAMDQEWPTPAGPQWKKFHWEGKKFRIGYRLKDGAPPSSTLQVHRNYETAIAKIGGTKVGGYGGTIGFEIKKGGALTAVSLSVYSNGGTYELTIIESQAMKQDVVADAAAMGADLKATGRTVIPGIYFATNSAVIKPESEPALVEMTKLLKGSAALKAYIVGHTDNAGTLEGNLKLSADRADALVKALVGRGIAAGRLKPAGVASYSPIASNKEEKGRAQNRRVEMVEQ